MRWWVKLFSFGPIVGFFGRRGFGVGLRRPRLIRPPSVKVGPARITFGRRVSARFRVGRMRFRL